VSEPESARDQPIEIAGYRIDRVLARGGMSVVYLGQNTVLRHWAALKVLPVELARNPAIRARFQREGETTARLGHPNVVAPYGRGETTNGELWIAMQYVEGTDAESALRTGAMTPARALRIVSEVAEVLDYAHRSGVVHQDVKPSNILLGERLGKQERVVLADFGAAVILSAASECSPGDALVASFAYTAPEVITGDTAIDGRADVYSLGCTLFRLLTGSVPFPEHTTAAAMAHAHLEQPAPKLSALLPWAPPALDAVMAKALAKRPADRYATAGELAAAAAAALTPSPRPSPFITPPPPRISVTPVESRRRALPESKRWLILGGAAAGVLVAAVFAWLAFTGHDDNAAPISHPPMTTSTPAPPPRKMVLPSGYPPGACTRQDPTDPGTEVVMTCGPNQDPGGPFSATYSLARDAQSLNNAMAHVIGAATTVICPGNIASPGPWRRLADPATPKGTLFCGIGSDGRPLIAWTFDPDRFLAVVQVAPALDGSGLNSLYAWWSSHS
jgi:serine/threonine protein kinase